MRTLDRYHPATVAVFFAATVAFLMLGMNPILIAISLVGAISYLACRGGGGRIHLLFLLLFWVMTLINPLVSHNGETVLFFFNQMPITLEATLWGASSAGAVITVLYWFRAFTAIMTADRLLCLFGLLSPRLALTLSMAFRYVPLFTRQMRRVNRTQTAMGLYREDHIVSRLRGGTRVFSVMLTWALENGIVTADSMAARGYGIGRRTHFTVIRFGQADAILLVLVVCLSALVAVPALMGGFSVAYYPHVTVAPLDAWALVGYLAYGILCMIPTCLELWEVCRWKFLRSSI